VTNSSQASSTLKSMLLAATQKASYVQVFNHTPCSSSRGVNARPTRPKPECNNEVVVHYQHLVKAAAL
jgi:hypothetical protein